MMTTSTLAMPRLTATVALFATAAAASCATSPPRVRSMTPAEPPVGTAAGAEARALIYARGAGLLAAVDSSALDGTPYGVDSLQRESGADRDVHRVVAALAPGLCGPIDIAFEDLLTQPPFFRLTKLSLTLDDIAIAQVDDVDATNARRYLIFHGRVAPGQHVLRAKVTYRGGGDARGYTWNLRDRVTIGCGPERPVAALRVVVFPRATEWPDAPAIKFAGDFQRIEEPRPLFVDNELAASLAALRVDVAAGLVPEDVASRPEIASTMSPLVDHALTPAEKATVEELRQTVRGPSCLLSVELGDHLSDDAFRLASVKIDVDGVPVLDAPSYDLPTLPEHRRFLLLRGPVATTKHTITAELHFGAVPSNTVDWKLADSAVVDCHGKANVSLDAVRCMNRLLAKQPELRVSVDGTYSSTGCEER